MSDWVIALRETGTRRVVLVTSDVEKIDAADPTWEQDVHIVPGRMENGEYRFQHQCERTCYCHPEIRHRDHGRTLVIHSERVN